jgi:hypothetical protein
MPFESCPYVVSNIATLIEFRVKRVIFGQRALIKSVFIAPSL